MSPRFLALAALLVGTLVAVPLAQTPTMPLDEVRPGMVGVGRTVFSGTRLEDFKVEILGVLRNVLAPKRSLILARLEGGPLAKTGVIAGMSGSPSTSTDAWWARCPIRSASFRPSPSPASRQLPK